MNTTKTPTRSVYDAFGFPILSYVVPTAATAGLLTILAHTIDGTASGERLLLGWFAAVLFVVSTGHSDKHDDQSVPSILLDLAESFVMVAAFHSLGLVTTEKYESNGGFYILLSAYLWLIVGRRVYRCLYPDEMTELIKGLWADRLIFIFTVVVAAAVLVFGLGFDDIRTWSVYADRVAPFLLWAILIMYLFMVLLREGQLAKRRQGLIKPACPK